MDYLYYINRSITLFEAWPDRQNGLQTLQLVVCKGVFSFHTYLQLTHLSLLLCALEWIPLHSQTGSMPNLL